MDVKSQLSVSARNGMIFSSIPWRVNEKASG